MLGSHRTQFEKSAVCLYFQLTALYKNSPLAASFNRVEIEAFSPGSIIVDYYVVLNEVATPITTQVRDISFS